MMIPLWTSIDFSVLASSTVLLLKHDPANEDKALYDAGSDLCEENVSYLVKPLLQVWILSFRVKFTEIGNLE